MAVCAAPLAPLGAGAARGLWRGEVLALPGRERDHGARAAKAVVMRGDGSGLSAVPAPCAPKLVRGEAFAEEIRLEKLPPCVLAALSRRPGLRRRGGSRRKKKAHQISNTRYLGTPSNCCDGSAHATVVGCEWEHTECLWGVIVSYLPVSCCRRWILNHSRRHFDAAMDSVTASFCCFPL